MAGTISPDALRDTLGPIAEAYSHLSGAFAAIAEHVNSEEFERVEVDEIGELSAFHSWARDRAERDSELGESLRKAIIALSASQSIADARRSQLPQTGFSTISTESGTLARTFLTQLDEPRIARLAQGAPGRIAARLRSAANDLSALIATASHAPIPLSAFVSVGESKGALVPLLEGVESQFKALLNDLPGLLEPEATTRPVRPFFGTV
jgi:hypothetical protein